MDTAAPLTSLQDTIWFFLALARNQVRQPGPLVSLATYDAVETGVRRGDEETLPNKVERLCIRICTSHTLQAAKTMRFVPAQLHEDGMAANICHCCSESFEQPLALR